MSDNQLITVTDQNFETEVLNSPLPFLLFFTAPWCGPCRNIETPILEQCAGEYAGKVLIGALDIDQNQITPESYGIKSIPAYIIFEQGKSAAQEEGELSKSQVQDFINTHI